jgi:polar amino acid transport system substrate-binding protein
MTSTDRPRRSGGRFRAFTRLRGWGGVSAMGAACVVTAALTLLPLLHTSREAVEQAEQSAGSLVTAVPAKADQCVNPEASLPPSGADGPTIAKIKARGRLWVGVDQNSYQWGYRDPASPNGSIEGFDIDLAHAIAADILGDPNKITFRAIPTNLRVQALQNGSVDIVVRTMTINCERKKQVAFSTAYFQAGQQVLAPKSDPSIKGYDASLAGKRVCTAQGSTAYDQLVKKSYGAIFKDPHDGTVRDEDQLTVPNQLDCLVRLQLGEVDAVVTDNALAAGQVAQDPAVQLRGKPFTTEYYGVAVKLGNDDLVRRVNQVLVGYRAGGTASPWMVSYRHWLKAGLPGITGPPAAKYE